MYNVFSLGDVERCGIHREQVRRAVGCCIERLGRGVYVLRRACERPRHRELQYRITHQALVIPPTAEEAALALPWWEQDLTEHLGTLKAIKLLPEDVVSHHSAARLWGLPLLHRSAKRIEVSHPHKRRTGKTIHRHLSAVPDSDIATDADFRTTFGMAPESIVGPDDLGVRVTTLERTVVDICREGLLSEAVMVTDAYLGGLMDPPMTPGAAPARKTARGRAGAFAGDGGLREFPLDATEREARRGRLIEVANALAPARGRGQFGKAMAICTGLSESPAESLANLGFYELELPVVQQFRIDDDQGLIGIADFRIKGTNLLFEVDGVGKYRDQQNPHLADMSRLTAEKDRTDRIHRRGYLIERGTYADVSRPERFGPLIWRALRAARLDAQQPRTSGTRKSQGHTF